MRATFYPNATSGGESIFDSGTHRIYSPCQNNSHTVPDGPPRRFLRTQISIMFASRFDHLVILFIEKLPTLSAKKKIPT